MSEIDLDLTLATEKQAELEQSQCFWISSGQSNKVSSQMVWSLLLQHM